MMKHNGRSEKYDLRSGRTRRFNIANNTASFWRRWCSCSIYI